ncbi:MAG TPA: VOC family protein [Pyrinomonadaceae bacterium]|nr:VOC family protein [Pyrinomonadaceae bacterium]
MKLNLRLNRKGMTVYFAVFAVAAVTAVAVARSNEEKPRMINKSTPVLHVKAVEPSLKFWTERFGFKTTIQVPERDHIGFAAIDNGSVELMYQTYEGMQANPSDPLAKAAEQGPTFIFMEVPNIKAIASALHESEVVKGIYETGYGAKEIVAKEPGGHYVIFSQLPNQTKP